MDAPESTGGLAKDETDGDCKEQLKRALHRIKELEGLLAKSQSHDSSKISTPARSAPPVLTNKDFLITPSVGGYFTKWKSSHPITFVPHIPLLKNFWSSVTAFVGIAIVSVIGQYGFHPINKISLMPSLGAVAVLIYAVEASPLAQPHSVLFGNILSAIVGIIVEIIFQGTTIHWLKEALAVSIAIFVMGITKSTHPPAGATALFAVTNAQVKCQGWFLLLSPVILSLIVMLLVSVVLTNLQNNRSFPQYWIVEFIHRKTIGRLLGWADKRKNTTDLSERAESSESLGTDAGSETIDTTSQR